MQEERGREEGKRREREAAVGAGGDTKGNWGTETKAPVSGKGRF